MNSPRAATAAFVRDSFLSLMGYASLALLNAVTGILAARLLGPEGRGELAAIQLWPTLLAVLAMVGMPEALTYFSARDRERVGSYLGSALMIALLGAGALLIPCLLLLPVLMEQSSETVIDAARVYLLILVPLYALVGTPLAAFRGVRLFKIWNLLRVLPSVAWLAVLLIAWARGTRSASAVSFEYLAGLLLVGAVVWITVRRVISGSMIPRRDLIRPLLSFGLPSMGGSIPHMLNLRTDQLLMVALVAPRALGLYSAAVAWSGAFVPLFHAFATVVLPEVAGRSDGTSRARFLARGLRLAAGASVLASCVMLLATPLIFPILFGESFRPGLVAALLLVPAAGVLGFLSVAEEAMRGAGRPKSVLIAQLAGLPISLSLLLLLLPKYGIGGAALASLVGYCSVAAVLVWHARGATGMQWRDLIVLRGSDLAAVTEAVRLPLGLGR